LAKQTQPEQRDDFDATAGSGSVECDAAWGVALWGIPGHTGIMTQTKFSIIDDEHTGTYAVEVLEPQKTAFRVVGFQTKVLANAWIAELKKQGQN
jgi:hypothetical protein